jgi:hypothetical protein
MSSGGIDYKSLYLKEVEKFYDTIHLLTEHTDRETTLREILVEKEKEIADLKAITEAMAGTNGPAKRPRTPRNPAPKPSAKKRSRMSGSSPKPVVVKDDTDKEEEEKGKEEPKVHPSVSYRYPSENYKGPKVPFPVSLPPPPPPKELSIPPITQGFPEPPKPKANQPSFVFEDLCYGVHLEGDEENNGQPNSYQENQDGDSQFF